MELHGRVRALQKEKDQLDDELGALKKTNEQLAASASAAQAFKGVDDEHSERDSRYCGIDPNLLGSFDRMT